MLYVLAPTQDKHFDLWIFKTTFVLKKEAASSVSPKFTLTFIKGAQSGLFLLKIQGGCWGVFGSIFQDQIIKEMRR